MQGWEFTKSLNPEEMSDMIAKRAITVLRAKPCPAGKMPVIIDNGFGGVIFHEACGHLLETTAVEKIRGSLLKLFHIFQRGFFRVLVVGE